MEYIKTRARKKLFQELEWLKQKDKPKYGFEPSNPIKIEDEEEVIVSGSRKKISLPKSNIKNLTAEPSKSNLSSEDDEKDDDSCSSSDNNDVDSYTSDETFDKNSCSDDESDSDDSSSSSELGNGRSQSHKGQSSKSQLKKRDRFETESIYTDMSSSSNDNKNESGRKRKLEAPRKSLCQGEKTKSMKMARKDCDFVAIIYNSDSDIEDGNDEDLKSSESRRIIDDQLPLKFRFCEPEEPVKSESKIDVDYLFQELNFVKQCGQQNDDDGGNDDPHISEADMTPFELCQIGKHKLRLDEQIGEICVYCGHITREIRYILPDLIQLKSDASDRERCVWDEHVGSFYDEFIDPAEDFRLFEHKKGTVWELLPAIHLSMYPHQIEGFEFLWKNLAGTIQLEKINEKNLNDFGGCIISHAPGTGKTRMTIAFISSYLKRFPACHPVVIAPASMLLTWEEEFNKWKVDFPFYNLNNHELSGNESKSVLDILGKSDLNSKTRTRMVKARSWDRNPGVLGISYSLYTKNLADGNYKNGKIKKFWAKTLLEKPGLVVLDEGHTPRSKESVIFKALQKLQTRKRIILSGTPFQNNFEELENTLRVVQPDIADSVSKNSMFVEAKKRDSTIKNGEMWAGWLKKFSKKISPFVDVYKGSILQKTLPGLSKCTIHLNPDEFQKKIIDIIDSSHTMESDCKATLVTIHPSLILSCKLSEREKDLIHNYRLKLRKYEFNHSKGVKTKFIVRLVQFSIALNEKVLIFSQFRAPLDFIMAQLNHSFGWGEGKVVKIQGKQHPNHRQKIINDFNDPDSEAKVMLASTKCCKEGISLTGASRVVLLDVVWNPSVEKQAISRAYRIGQKKKVYSYHLITATEVTKHDCQTEKDRLSELIFCPKENDRTILTNDKELVNDKILDAILTSKLADMFSRIVYQTNTAESS